MKKTLLVISVIFAAIAVGCTPEKTPTASKDEDLAGETVTVGENLTCTKLFVLNEGGYKGNNASLDFLSFKKGKYVRNAYSQMNDGAPLGDTGNDIAVNDGKVWIVLNGSDLVTVINAADEILVGEIAIPSPRSIAFDGKYAYVSSYAGAVYGAAEATPGKVFRIDTTTLKTDGEVTVGCQPEGLAFAGGKLYVANSGGYQANGSYEKTLSVIDPASFTVTGTIEVADNLKSLISDDQGILWATTYGIGEYDGNWAYSQTIACGLYKVNPGTMQAKEIENVHASVITYCNGFLYIIGNADELVYTEAEEGTKIQGWNPMLYVVNTSSGLVTAAEMSGKPGLNDIVSPYGIAVNPANGDIYIADAGDYTNPGTVRCLTKELSLKWKVSAGILPGHFAFL